MFHTVFFIDGDGKYHQLIEVHLDRENGTTFTPASCIYNAESIDAVIACAVKAKELIDQGI